METIVKIVYALPVYQSVILSVFLFIGSKRNPGISKKIMAVFQLLMALYFTFNFLYSMKAIEAVSMIYFLILPAILMFIPVFHLYILSITSPGFRINKTHFIHFLPALVVAILNLPYLAASRSQRIEFSSHGYNELSNNPLFAYLLMIYMLAILGIFTFQLIFYSIRAFKLYRNHKIYLENRYSYTENINLDWILVLIICFVIFFVFNDILFLLGFRQQLLTQLIYNFAMLITTLYIGYRGLQQVELTESRELYYAGTGSSYASVEINPEGTSPQVGAEEKISSPGEKPGTQDKPEIVKKYSGSALSESQKKLLLSKLDDLMHQDKIFINDKLTLENVAMKLDTNTKYISQIINETYNKNFYNFINAYRVEEARRLLVSEGNEKYSILGIAQSAGFVSKSAFNAAFKRITGQTPSEFRNSNAI